MRPRIRNALAWLAANVAGSLGCAHASSVEVPAASSRPSSGRPMTRRRATLPGARGELGPVLESAHVGLGDATLTWSWASRCRRVPEVPLGHPVRPAEAEAVGCRLRRATGEWFVRFVRGDAGRAVVVPVSLSRDGVVRLDYAALDDSLAARGEPGVFAFDRLEMGDPAHPFRISLADLRARLAERHFVWIRQGRGSPGLWWVAHPEGGQAWTAHVWSVEAARRREADDARSVREGRLSPWAFDERHPRSVHAASVRSRRGLSVSRLPKP